MLFLLNVTMTDDVKMNIISAKINAVSEEKNGSGGKRDLNDDAPDTWCQRRRKQIERWNRKSRRNCRRAVKSQAMFWFIIILVLLNTCVLATEHYNQPHWLEHFQEIANMFFVVLFTVEMLLKMYALGFQVRPKVHCKRQLLHILHVSGLLCLLVQSV